MEFKVTLFVVNSLLVSIFLYFWSNEAKLEKHRYKGVFRSILPKHRGNICFYWDFFVVVIYAINWGTIFFQKHVSV